MKKVFAILMAASVALSLLGGVTAFAENQYMTNGDFETGDLTGWRNKTAPTGTVCEVREDAKGNHYLYMEAPTDTEDPGDSPIVRIATTEIQGLQSKDLVTLSYDLKIDELGEGAISNTGANLGVAFKDKDNNSFIPTVWHKHYENRGEWAHYEIDILIPETATGIGFGLRLYGGGKVSWDNIELRNGKNKTNLSVEYLGTPLDRIPDGINSVTAKMHYVSESGNTETGNLIFAAYGKEANGKKALLGLKIAPFTTSASSNSVFLTEDINLPADSKDISVKAYIWKNGSTLEAVADSEVLPKAGRKPVFDRFVTEKMRGVYGSINYFLQDEVIDRLVDAGINTIIALDDKYGDFDAHAKKLAQLGEIAQERNLMVFTKSNYSSGRAVSSTAYGAYHPGRPHSYTGPCRLATGYWEKGMLDVLAIGARTPGITGGVFDMEMYNTGGGGAWNEPCFCDTCVAHYASDHPSSLATALVNTVADERIAFSKQNSILTEYTEWQNGEVTKIAASLREKLHAINPDFMIGVMPYHSWFPGLDEGLGTEEMPLVIFSEAYSAVLTRAYSELASMEQKNLFGVYSRGIGPSESFVTLDLFKDRVVDASVLCSGYFLYEIKYLEDNYAAATEETETTYYAELKKANDELDTLLGLD